VIRKTVLSTHLVPVLVLTLLGLSGLVLFITSNTVHVAGDAVAAAVEQGELARGGATGAFDAEVERTHPLREVAIPVVAAARYLLLRQGNPGVVVGREGWLFTTEEFQHHSEDERILGDRLDYVREVADLLQRNHSAALVVVIVPSKARVAEKLVPRYLEPAVFHDRLPRAEEALRMADMTVVNGADALGPEDFFRRDTHWKPRGALRVAQAVRTVLGESSQFGATYRAHRTTAETIEGDLLSFVPAGPWNRVLGLTSERYRSLEAVLERGGSGSGGLFDTPQIPVTLVGTSYSEDDRFGFAAALRVALGGDVLNVAEPAGGPYQPMAAYLQGNTILDVPPELVVWEIPERYLTLPGVDTPPLRNR
jgi:alginate O-acetyltransferase complex protein AlgJ